MISDFAHTTFFLEVEAMLGESGDEAGDKCEVEASLVL